MGQSARRSTRAHHADEVHIGNYKLLKTIGKGNFAKVKLATHVLTDVEVSFGCLWSVLSVANFLCWPHVGWLKKVTASSLLGCHQDQTTVYLTEQQAVEYLLEASQVEELGKYIRILLTILLA